MKEEWRAVPGYEGMYEVSSIGRVRGLDRVIKRCTCGLPIRRAKGRMLKWIMHKFGYPMVSLSKGNKYKQRFVHALVLEAFIGPRPRGADACHNNGRRDDPRVENLRWDTRRGNLADMAGHGTVLLGEKANSAKLTPAAVLEIRASKEAPHLLAAKHGVGSSAVRRIRKRETWRHL